MNGKMMHPQIDKIMRQERERMMREIDELPMHEQARDDVIMLCFHIQNAINGYVSAEARTIDGRVFPTAVRLMTEEFERVRARLEASGLTPRQGPDIQA